MLKKLSLSLLLVAAMATPSFAVSKEIIELQQRVDLLMAQVRDLQHAFDSNIAAVKSLVSQNTDTVNKLNVAISEIQQTLQAQNTTSSQRQDQIAQQFQALSDSLDELKTRLNSMNEVLGQVRQAQTNIAPPPAATTGVTQVQPGAAGAPTPNGATGAAATPALPADQLYRNALSDYVSGKYALAKDEFSNFLSSFPNDDHAAESAYYLGDIYAKQHDYTHAIEQFDRVLENYPDHKLTPSAELKKGYALAAMGRKDAAIREFRSLVAHYPRSQEARQARDELQYMGASGSNSGSRRRRS